MSPVVKVLYLGGWMHSGSTLLGRVLGELDGAFAAGEVGRFGMTDLVCACGEPRPSCPFWSEITAQAFGDRAGAAEIRRFDQLSVAFRANRSLASTVLALRGHGRRVAAMREYRSQLGALYRAIGQVTGAGVIVDTTKSPIFAEMLEGIAGIDVRLVQLVRDPRGTLLSNLEREDRVLSPVTSVTLWALSHLALELLWRPRGSDRYRLLRYEDFAGRPRESTAQIARFAGLDAEQLPFLGSTRVVLGGSHFIAGHSSMRWSTGTIEIEPDEEWRAGLGSVERATTTAAMLPLLLRHGYALLDRR